MASGGPASTTPLQLAPGPNVNSPPTAPAPRVPDQLSGPTAAAAAGTKKIHTVAIRPDQAGGSDAAQAAAPPPAATTRAAPAAHQTAAPTAPQGGNGPLSIVPQPGDAAPAPQPRTHTALARPTAPSPAAEAAPAAGGGYAVQVSSQRSEADAQTSFRALQAKYPSQLGGHQPMVRRADLGDKGIYYRALVGPFASQEQATSLCSSLKAAGGSCIVQRN